MYIYIYRIDLGTQRYNPKLEDQASSSRGAANNGHLFTADLEPNPKSGYRCCRPDLLD